MNRWRAILAHAFAVEKPGPAKPTPEESEVVDRVLREVVRRGMTLPAQIFLESIKPMSFLGSQTMHFFAPFAGVLVRPASYRAFSTFLEKRGAAEYLIRRLETLNEEPPGSDRAPDAPPPT